VFKTERNNSLIDGVSLCNRDPFWLALTHDKDLQPARQAHTAASQRAEKITASLFAAGVSLRRTGSLALA
jgi:hypothetical protein